MTGKLVVVFGGSGFVGRHVVRELAEAGWRVRVAVRRPHLAQFLRPLGAVGQIQLTQCNIRFPHSVQQQLEGADAVVNLVGILAQTNMQKFGSVQTQGARHIADAAAAAGVSKFVHLSAIGADDASQSDYARSKSAGEAGVLQAVPEANILRPSVIFGAKDAFFNRFASMACFSFCLPLIGGGRTRFQPVHVGDIAHAVRVCLEGKGEPGRVYELGGPRIYTFRALMEIMLRVIARKRLLLTVPFPVASMMGHVAQWASVIPFVVPPITADQVTLLKSDNVVGMTNDSAVGTFADLAIEPAMLETILPTYLVRFRKYGQFSPETPA